MPESPRSVFVRIDYITAKNRSMHEVCQHHMLRWCAFVPGEGQAHLSAFDNDFLDHLWMGWIWMYLTLVGWCTSPHWRHPVHCSITAYFFCSFLTVCKHTWALSIMISWIIFGWVEYEYTWHWLANVQFLTGDILLIVLLHMFFVPSWLWGIPLHCNWKPEFYQAGVFHTPFNLILYVWVGYFHFSFEIFYQSDDIICLVHFSYMEFPFHSLHVIVSLLILVVSWGFFWGINYSWLDCVFWVVGDSCQPSPVIPLVLLARGLW